MADKFTQFSFDFGDLKAETPTKFSSSPKENRFTPITLETGLDKTEIRNTAMLTLRGLISQNLRRCTSKDSASLKNRVRFMVALGSEIKFKRSSTSSVHLIQETLLRTTL
jgi:hypothetical protein